MNCLILEQAAWVGCGVSLPGDIQKLTEHGPEKSAVADPALRRGDWTRRFSDILSNFNHSVFTDKELKMKQQPEITASLVKEKIENKFTCLQVSLMMKLVQNHHLNSHF